MSRQKPAAPAGAYFLVDPIDGTREFLAGRDEYTVNVALVENAVPVLGVIYAPARHALYAGAAGNALRATLAPGQQFDPDSASAIRARSRQPRLTALVSRSHPDAKSDEVLASLPVARKIPLGSSLKFACLAEGEADVYARVSTVNEWDVAAGHALLEAAGGRVTAPGGGPLVYGDGATGFRIDGFVAWGGPPASARG
jgi:3'(2'), 5'-bisphosphate nucleotidase